MSSTRTQSRKGSKPPISELSGTGGEQKHSESKDSEGAAIEAMSPVELSTLPLKFSPVNAITSVFFDETNKQVRFAFYVLHFC